MKCLKCGQEMPEGAKFCVRCGAPVAEPSQDYRYEAPVQRRSRWKPIYTILIILAAVFVFVLMIGFASIIIVLTVKDKPLTVESYVQQIEEYLESQEKEEEEPAIDIYEGDEYVYEQDEPDRYYGDGYILPFSDSMYYSKSDLYGLSKWECKLARNEIYARHGRRFNDDSLQTYFSQFDWYSPRIDPDDFKESMLNKYEIKNRDLIVAYEKEMGYSK